MTGLLNMMSLAASNPLEHVVDHPLWKGGFITSHMIMLLLSAALMLLIFPRITRRYRSGELVPTGTRNFFEAIIIYVREDVARPVLAENTDRFMPFLWTLFFFILFNNLLGLIPIEAITGYVLPHGIGGTATGNIYVTGALAAISFVVTQAAGIRANGFGNYAKHFLGGAPAYMAPIMIPVEIIGLFVKPFALAIRLFANMCAGHILLAVLIGFPAAAGKALGGGGLAGVGIVSIIGATAIMVLEVFVAFLQAYLFTFLTSMFIGQLVVHDHEHGEHDEHAHTHHGKEDMALGAGDMTDHSLPENVRHA
jgi:F-type H+-transporting ATPase subunit a